MSWQATALRETTMVQAPNLQPKASSLQSPLLFAPFVRPMVWGGRRLGDLLGKALPNSEPCGESWDIADHALHSSVVVNPPHSGLTLHQLMMQDRRALLGAAADDFSAFPWLVKFLDASDWLSVQVHPDADRVGRLWPGEGAKTEAWFVLDAQPGSRIWAGLLPGIDEPKLRAALANGTVADCLYNFQPQPGDCVFLPAGTVHAVGGGVLMAEIQQTSDATFRLFDWNRRDAHGKSRQLHVEQALACIDWSRGPVEPFPATSFARAPAGLHRQELVRCRYFVLEYVRSREPVELGGTGQLQSLIILQGRGKLVSQAGEARLTVGQAWVLPAATRTATCQPGGDLGFLLCTLP